MSASTAALMICLPSILPLWVWTISHRAISSTLELIEPAGPTLVMSRNGIATTLSSRSSYGLAKSAAFCESLTEKLLPVIPSGLKIRARTASSHDWPVNRSTRYPAVMNMILLY